MQVEHPAWCGYAPAFHFHATLVGMLSPTLIGDQVVQMGQPREKCLLTPTRMMKPVVLKKWIVATILKYLVLAAYLIV